MEFGVLGPLEVVVDGRPVELSAAKERALLAALLAGRNRAVPVDDLVDAVWGSSPPRTAAKTLQTYVLHLRRHVGDRLVRRAPGYLLRVDDGELDLDRFERRVAEGRLALLRGAAGEAVATIGAALAEWRGSPFEDVGAPALAAEVTRLEVLRGDATEAWCEARLAVGDLAGLVQDVEAALDRDPLRERLWSFLMRALYLSGRQADALRAFQRARTVLAEQVGVEPGPELRRVEAAILGHDPGLEQSEPSPVPTYATTADGLRVAYWTRGDGESTVCLCAEWVFNLELLWEMPELRPFLDRLSRSARLVVVQRRGTGLSDRTDAVLDPPAACVDDVDAVLDATGSGRVALVGWGHGGQVAIEYAAARPERVTRLAVVNGYARLSSAPGYDAGLDPGFLESLLGFMEQVWGTDAPVVPIFGPVVGLDPDLRTRVARINRLLCTPRQAVATQRTVHGFDVRARLPAVTCPSLVVYLDGSTTGRDNARWLAANLPAGEYLELPGAFIPTDAEAATLADALLGFLSAPSRGAAASAGLPRAGR